MKKLAFICVICLAACTRKKTDGTYVTHWHQQFSIADDTLKIENSIVTKRTAFSRIRDGKVQKREYEVERWRLNEFGTPVITFQSNTLTCGTTVYKKID